MTDNVSPPEFASTTDTPTHRTTLSQLKMREIAQLVTVLQTRRAAIVEKVRKARENSKIAEERKINKQLERIMKKIEKKLQDAEAYIDIAADELNKARGLFLEVTDGEVLLTKTELTHGSLTASTKD